MIWFKLALSIFTCATTPRLADGALTVRKAAVAVFTALPLPAVLPPLLRSLTARVDGERAAAGEAIIAAMHACGTQHGRAGQVGIRLTRDGCA